jgi:hypothetical protein
MLLEPRHSEAWIVDVMVFLASARSYGVLLNFTTACLLMRYLLLEVWTALKNVQKFEKRLNFKNGLNSKNGLNFKNGPNFKMGSILKMD